MAILREFYETVMENYAHHDIHSGFVGEMLCDMPPEIAKGLGSAILVEMVRDSVAEGIEVLNLDGKLVLRRAKDR